MRDTPRCPTLGEDAELPTVILGHTVTTESRPHHLAGFNNHLAHPLVVYALRRFHRVVVKYEDVHSHTPLSSH